MYVSMYLYVVLCIVCFVMFPVLFVHTEQLPLGGYPIAVKYIINKKIKNINKACHKV
jgi:hypothetical protein